MPAPEPPPTNRLLELVRHLEELIAFMASELERQPGGLVGIPHHDLIDECRAHVHERDAVRLADRDDVAGEGSPSPSA